MRRGNSIHLSESRHLGAKAVLHWLVLREYLNPKGYTFLWKNVTSPTGFAKEFFVWRGAAKERRGTRSKSYADERFRAATKPNGKYRSKMLFENYTEEEMT